MSCFFHSENSFISINYRNYSTSKNKNQHSKKNISPLSANPDKEMRTLSGIELQIINYIRWLSTKFKSVYFSQSHIAKKFNCSRKTANKYLGILERRGYLRMRRNKFSTNDYFVSDYFKLIPVRKLLTSLLRPQNELSFSGLMLHIEKILKSKVTRVISPLVFIKFLSSWISKGGGLSTKKIVKNHVSHRKRKGFLMNNPIIPEILGIKSITMLEKVQLSAFPKEAIMYALKMLPKNKALTSVFCWIRFVCKDYCKLHELEPNYQWASQLEAAYKSNPKQFSVVDKLSTTQKSLSPSYLLGPQKREGGSNVAKDHETYMRFLAKKKSWVQSLPLPSEQALNSMKGFFPGTPEEAEEFILKQLNHRQTVDSSLQPAYNDATNSNEDDLQSTMWEFAL